MSGGTRERKARDRWLKESILEEKKRRMRRATRRRRHIDWH